MSADDFVGGFVLIVMLLVVILLAKGCSDETSKAGSVACWDKTKREECWK